MTLISWLQHEAELAQRGTVALPASVVLVTFLTLAIGAAVYDIGQWLAIW